MNCAHPKLPESGLKYVGSLEVNWTLVIFSSANATAFGESKNLAGSMHIVYIDIDIDMHMYVCWCWMMLDIGAHRAHRTLRVSIKLQLLLLLHARTAHCNLAIHTCICSWELATPAGFQRLVSRKFLVSSATCDLRSIPRLSSKLHKSQRIELILLLGKIRAPRGPSYCVRDVPFRPTASAHASCSGCHYHSSFLCNKVAKN
jgi:hypothetical protein